MRSRWIRRPALGMAVCTAAFVSAACFGGGGGSQPTPQATAGISTAIPAGASPIASPPSIPSPFPLSSPVAGPSPARPTGAEQTHTVEVGDTLGTIAQKFYDDPSLWRKIYEANRAAIGDNPDAIKVGTQLRIPPKE